MRLPFADLMKNQGDENRYPHLSRWSDLPKLCCSAAGGAPERAEYLSLAWKLIYFAADIMDTIQDGDPADDWAEEIGPAGAISVATGLYFSANLALSHMLMIEESNQAAVQAAHYFYTRMMCMASGQYDDVRAGEMTLERYWRQAEAKSGAFFSAATRAGAQLATDDTQRLESFEAFGVQAGVLIQISDDLGDVFPQDRQGEPGQNPNFSSSLPVVYALDVLPPDKRGRLLSAVQTAHHNPQDAREVIALVDESYAAKFVRLQIDIRREKAARLLEDAGAISPGKDKLLKLIAEF